MNFKLNRLWDMNPKQMTELITIKDYKEPYYILSNDRLMNILQVKTRNLSSANKDEIEYYNLMFTRLYKTYADDLKIIAINFPTDTKEQQEYIKHKIATTNNTIFNHLQKQKLAQLELIEKKRTDKEFYIMFYADDNLKYYDNLGIIQKNLGEVNIIEIDREKKNQVLYKINNKNSSIFI